MYVSPYTLYMAKIIMSAMSCMAKIVNTNMVVVDHSGGGGEADKLSMSDWMLMIIDQCFSKKNVQMLSMDDSEEEEEGVKSHGCWPHVHLLPRYCK